jgi:3-deoxy-manno-octulosonate cytidylyltransferase (CMP-KDO synthetase)
MKVIAVIPARYASTRFPGKILANQTGKYLIEHIYEQACKAGLVEKIIIATDNENVQKAARTFGAEAVMTNPRHQSGTDRIAEAVMDIDCDIVINIQGDEPEIPPENIDRTARLLLDNPKAQMATLASPLNGSDEIANPNIVKVVIDDNDYALYFSRASIPYDRDNKDNPKPENYLRHIGIYAYRKDFLTKLTKLPQSSLEKLEKLEQLRALQNGYNIKIGKTSHQSEGIDTPEQYAEFVKRYKNSHVASD